MELLFNVAWLTVAISLWGLWFVRRRCARKGSLRRSVPAEVIALAMLTTILLPAISITDDLHSCQLPAEIKRSVLQSNQHLAPAASPSVLPFALALLVLLMYPLNGGIVSFLTGEVLVRRQMWSYAHSIWCRPPPAAIA